jgi:hypothetical protein
VRKRRIQILCQIANSLCCIHKFIKYKTKNKNKKFHYFIPKHHFNYYFFHETVNAELGENIFLSVRKNFFVKATSPKGHFIASPHQGKP